MTHRGLDRAGVAAMEARLAARAGRGDGKAFAELADRYRGLIGRTMRLRVSGLEPDDERQEALIGLLDACRAYDPARGRFGALATVCVRRRVWEARAKARTRKHRMLTDALALDHAAGDEAGGPLGDRLAGPEHDDPAVVIELRDELRRIATSPRRSGRSEIRRRRYSEEQVARALAMVADGHTLREASAAIGASHPTVLRWLNEAA